jgi:Putative Actinobacterial Holin-X, holin superfamily III
VSAAHPGSPGEESAASPSQPAAGRDGEETQSIATAIAEVSERATLLVREEIELAKAEMRVKASRLVKGAVVGAAAGVFFTMALVFALVGCAWLLYYYLPIGNDYTYFWGFFAMAVILVVLGLLAGLVAARAVKKGSPPVPNMAIEEARKIREAVGSGPPAAGQGGEQGAPSPAAGAGVQS